MVEVCCICPCILPSAYKNKKGLKVTKCIFVLEKSVITIIFITRMNKKYADGKNMIVLILPVYKNICK